MEGKYKVYFYRILLILFFVFVVYVGIRPYLIKKDLEKYQRFTIAYIESIFYVKSRKSSQYSYYVNNKRDVNVISYFDGLQVSDRYYIAFSSKRPNWVVFLYKKVSDSIKNAPPEGWEKLPE